ncbi:hypothetical protein [Hymenobacter sublimis]|uniref:Uncharacterized protein n=1 Tax=Hymenobacter sublimis TaxID=2933777 RepID=A0ABY4J4H6_9BACT|nr:hypothetical protein [Hymenobacter sublimis]UPL47653.1 hypothetical protein MWH26_10630 [Hymenobacter sublimis]
MITAVIGRQFLAAYNAAHGLSLSVAEYFEERFIPLFFDHPKYIMHGGNSRLSNPPFKKGQYPDATDRNKRIGELLKFIREDPAGSSPVGFPSTDVLATTSGQVSGATMPISADEVMLSWVGGALGVGVQGALSLLIPVPEVLLALEQGWHVYRRLLTDRHELRPNQVNTWNGQWLRSYNASLGAQNGELLPADAFSVDKGIMSAETAPWTDVLLSLVKLLPPTARTQTVYVYNLGQTNTTVGFVPVDLMGIRKPFDLYRKLFGEGEYTSNRSFIQNLFGSGFGFRKACQAGAIGTYALLPKGLRGLMPATKPGEKTKLPDYSKNDNSLLVTYHVYISWLLAMLNDETLWSRAEEAADLLVLHRSAGKKLSRGNANAVDDVLQAGNRRNFIAALTTVVENAPTDTLDKFKSLAQRVDTMPPDNFPYFLTLVRFCYALADRQQAATPA